LTKKTWKVVYITFQNKKETKEITLGRLSDITDVKNAIKRMYGGNIKEVLSITEIAGKGAKTPKMEDEWVDRVDVYEDTLFVDEPTDYDKAIDKLIVLINQKLKKKKIPAITTEKVFDKETEFGRRVFTDNDTTIRIYDTKQHTPGGPIEFSFSVVRDAPKKAKHGAKTSKGFMVFNYTDNIYASPDTFKTEKEANDFIKEFRKRFEKQGYYRDNRMRQIAIKDIDLLAIPEDFNPFRKN
jgi:hypothetical protein